MDRRIPQTSPRLAAAAYERQGDLALRCGMGRARHVGQLASPRTPRASAAQATGDRGRVTPKSIGHRRRRSVRDDAGALGIVGMVLVTGICLGVMFAEHVQRLLAWFG